MIFSKQLCFGHVKPTDLLDFFLSLRISQPSNINSVPQVKKEDSLQETGDWRFQKLIFFFYHSYEIFYYHVGIEIENMSN